MAPQPPIKFRDLSQSGDGLSGHSSSSKAPVPDSACVPGNDGLIETTFNLPCGDGDVKTVSTATKAAGNTIHGPVTARPNDRPQLVECPTARPGNRKPVTGGAVYNGNPNGRFGSF
jgi:hypothetical protein